MMATSGSGAVAATKWPPKGFRANGDVYAKVPTSKELTALLSMSRTLRAQAKSCPIYACGFVQVASRIGCTWWEIKSTVYGGSPRVALGTLRTTVRATAPKKVISVYLRSREPLMPKITVSGIHISCYHSPRSERVPTQTYKRIVKPTPTPTAVASETPSPSATPTESASPTPQTS